MNYWLNPNTDTSGVIKPESRNKVIVVTYLFDVPSAEKAQMESSIKVGLKGEYPILFINNKINRQMTETFKSLIAHFTKLILMKVRLRNLSLIDACSVRQY